MSSFFIVLVRENFNTTITQEFERPYRLTGEWEVALTQLRLEPKLKPLPLFVLCDLVDYCNINNVPMQFLDLISSGNLRNSSPKYVRVVKKRFSSIKVNTRV